MNFRLNLKLRPFAASSTWLLCRINWCSSGPFHLRSKSLSVIGNDLKLQLYFALKIAKLLLMLFSSFCVLSTPYVTSKRSSSSVRMALSRNRKYQSRMDGDFGGFSSSERDDSLVSNKVLSFKKTIELDQPPNWTSTFEVVFCNFPKTFEALKIKKKHP